MIKLTLIQGDVIKVLPTLSSESVDCVITSPPYWALRNYRIEGQIGLENTFEEYIKKICDIFDEIKRILKKSGTCFVNLGDTYGSSKFDIYGEVAFKGRRIMDDKEARPSRNSVKGFEKSLIQIPNRFAIEMCNRGWILRNEIIWWKPNAMPCSVKDRFTIDFEKLFFFVKSKKYYFETPREPHKLESIKRAARARTSKKLDDSQCAVSYKSEYKGYDDLQGKLKRHELRGTHPEGRIKRCVWEIPTHALLNSPHIAAYPEELVEIPLLSGCPVNGIVLDPFVGSGTTMKVAKEFNRNSIGIELNHDYIEFIKKRLNWGEGLPNLIEWEYKELS